MMRLLLALALLIATPVLPAASPATESAPTPASDRFSSLVTRLADLVEPPGGNAQQTLSARLVVTEAHGVPSLAGRSLELAIQAPDRLRLSLRIDGADYTVARDGQTLWAHVPSRNWALIGERGVSLFQASQATDRSTLNPFALPISRRQLGLYLLMVGAEDLGPQAVEGVECDVLKVTPRAALVDLLRLPGVEARIWLRRDNGLPARILVLDNAQRRVQVDVRDLVLSDPWPAAKWALAARPQDKVERVALGHLVRFLDTARSSLNNRIPTLPPATGEKKVIAREGAGRLEMHDGTRVLFVKGTPAEMGRQQGVLLKNEVRDLTNRILYGVGVGTSIAKGSFFLNEIQSAQARVAPFMDPRWLAEMDAVADAAGLDRQEVRLANIFPELFHCSGFAIYGEATTTGRLYHGRILDYIRGFGLEQNAVVTVYQPDRGNAWVNIGYAGFTGSVTAMNQKKIAIGEMGGRGEGAWDGVPMAQLVRKVMEEADTIDQAVEIMKSARRTCEYYYVISDGNARRAVGIWASPTRFDTVWAGQAHERLPHAIKDAILVSADDRYLKLVERVRAGYGTFNSKSARQLMDRPVAMSSNIQSVLFAPETLDFWVANADSANVASHARYTHYNIEELLQPR